MIPPLEEQQIEQFLGRSSLRRGWEYYRNQAVRDAYRQNNELRASCTGSGQRQYQVHAEFDEQGILEARCTCPIGEDGHCKHVAAMLLCWMETPEQFTEFQAFQEGLDRCSRRQLIEMLQEAAEKRPDLRRMFENMLPGDETREELPGQEVYRQQVADILRRADDRPDRTGRLVESLLVFKDTGDTFVSQHEPSAAALVYEAIVNELLEQSQYLDRRHGEVIDVLHECVEALAGCLARLTESTDDRLRVFRTLLELYRADFLVGGLALGIDVGRMILAHASDEEREIVADWIRGMLPSLEARADRRVLGGLLIELAGDRLDEAGVLDLCRQTDRIFDLARRLVHRGMFDRACEEARRADEHELIRIADLLVRYRRRDLAVRLVAQRLESGDSAVLRRWLDDDQQLRAESEAVLQLTEQLFRKQPSFDVYRQLRNLGRQLGQWDTLHAGLIEFLRRTGQRPLLVRVHLDENDLDRALEAVSADQPSNEDSGLALRVAKVAERSRPQEALSLYREVAERLVAQRGRENYAEACRYLRKVRALMKRTGSLKQWNLYLIDLRRRHRPLRAFHEELASAGLLTHAKGTGPAKEKVSKKPRPNGSFVSSKSSEKRPH